MSPFSFVLYSKIPIMTHVMSRDLCDQVAFLMSPKSADLVPWQKWILSRTQVNLFADKFNVNHR